MSSAGWFNCAAFLAGTQIQSIAQIQNKKHSVLSLGSNEVAMLTLSSLYPSTAYDVYCCSEDFMGYQMSLETILETKISTSTTCCKEIVWSYTPAVLPAADELIPSTSTLFSFYLNAQPIYDVTIFINVTAVRCSRSSDLSTVLPTISPNSFYFSTASSDLSAKFLVSGTAGCFALIAVQALGVTQYNSPAAVLTQIAPVLQPPLPKLLSATYSNDARFIFVTYDSSTNQAQSVVPTFNTIFMCNEIMNGSDVGAATCQWLSPTTLRLNIVYESRRFYIGSKLFFLPFKIKASCSAGRTCSAYDFVPPSQVSIQAPLNPVVPVVVFRATENILKGFDMELDLTATTGQCGYSWRKMKWTLSFESSFTSPPAIQLTSFLNTYFNTTTDTLVTVPASMLAAGNYIISIYIENIFSASSTASRLIRVSNLNATVPQISIAGQASQTVVRWQALTLQALTQTTVNTDLSTVWSLDWSVYQGGIVNASLVSTSVDPRSFELRPFSLLSSTAYTVRVTIRNGLSSNVAEVRINVQPSKLIATIVGGSSQRVSSRSSVVVDASRSYDPDDPSEAPQLTFSWRCAVLIPTYGVSCGSDSLFQQSTPRMQFVNSIDGPLKSGFTYIFTVLVSGSGNRTANATTQIAVSAVEMPAVTTESFVTAVAANNPITLSGTVLTNLSATVNAEWSCSSINLTTVHSSPQSFSFKGPLSMPLSLQLPAYSLLPGLSYQFQLQAYYSAWQLPIVVAYSSITVVTSAPPQGGMVSHNLITFAVYNQANLFYSR